MATAKMRGRETFSPGKSLPAPHLLHTTLEFFAVTLSSLSTALIGLGSNLGDRQGALTRALWLLCQSEGVELCAGSSLYQSKAMYDTAQPDFLNGCVSVRTNVGAAGLLERLLGVEGAVGRVRDDRRVKGPRVVDLDLLAYGQQVWGEPGLRVPHPGIRERAFVLLPLAQVAPDWVHPQDGRTVRQMLEGVDQSACRKLVPWGQWTPK